MKRLGTLLVFTFTLALLAPGFAVAADDPNVKAESTPVERGAKKVSDGKTEGFEETAKGVGRSVVEGAKYSSARLEEAGKAAQPSARSAWGHARDAAVGFGHSLTVFLTKLFGH